MDEDKDLDSDERIKSLATEQQDDSMVSPSDIPCIPDALKSDSCSLQGYLCILDILRVNYLWPAVNVGVPEKIYKNIFEDRSGREYERASRTCIVLLSKLLVTACYECCTDEDVWHHVFHYPEGLSSSLDEVCCKPGAKEAFLQKIYRTNLFLEWWWEISLQIYRKCGVKNITASRDC